ncbi:4Fe-4S cluster-binding domain-containing protein [uncultured Ruegeria sp.]|uniref:KamA family radical SAM protein n=1 Tax=uncultured Ruegeria sp. TaxID=259304 RepID=UPI002636D360|nr:4Fe-4S cluster-binding domain-containing protein [uncultured Ruegeria sp.]
MTLNAKQIKYYTAKHFAVSDYWQLMSDDYRRVFRLTSKVLPFRINNHVLETLIDWPAFEDDPMFRLLFPQHGMLADKELALLEAAEASGPEAETLAIRQIRNSLNPQPAGQLTDNCPDDGSGYVEGVQHKYAETALFFPSAGQTCHAYCSFCFRWPQFVGEAEWKMQARETNRVVNYLSEHPEITDILITGGDPMIMNAKTMARYLEPLLEVPSIQTIRIGSKSLTYWPYRYLTDPDTEALMTLLAGVVGKGKSLAFMAHVNHWRELEHDATQEAISALRSIGAVIRMQAPLLRHINDEPRTWAKIWERCVSSGIVPYYMFVERDTGPKEYFEVPLARALDIYRDATTAVSGLARTARGPVMSTFHGKVTVDGVVTTPSGKAFSLRFLQAREKNLSGQSFLAQYNRSACWLDDLRPLPGQSFPHDIAQPTRRSA